jgi:polysaccharide pyruvyl transferase WcaK-like protein
LLVGDQGDTDVTQEFSVCLERLGRMMRSVLSISRTFHRAIAAPDAATDIVVATRFHNVIMALLLNKPVIAISFHKCASLMSQMDCGTATTYLLMLTD